MAPGLAALWDEEIERRKLKDMHVDNLGPPPSQPRLNDLPTLSHLAYKNQLEERLNEINDDVTRFTFLFSKLVLKNTDANVILNRKICRCPF